MLCTRRMSWGHASCIYLPPLAAGRKRSTLRSPSSEPLATLMFHLKLNTCGSAMQLFSQLAATLMAWRTCLSSESDRWNACLP